MARALLKADEQIIELGGVPVLRQFLPVPWEAHSLMIKAADGETVLHLGGQQSYTGDREGDVLCELARRIVNAVNAQEAKE
jgi:hypothetical protein